MNLIRNYKVLCIGLCNIPTLKYNKEWITMYNRSKLNIKNVLLLTTKNDIVIDHDYVSTFVKELKKKTYVNHKIFMSGNHFNITKDEAILYQELLDNHIRKFI